MKRSKKYQEIIKKIDETKKYSTEEAISLIKENRVTKFDESMEVHIKLNINPKKGDQQFRGSVVLPHGTGKIRKVAVITTTKEAEAKEAKADIVAGEDLIGEIEAGKINFDVLVATPEMMPKLAKVAKILGPRGLMPSPKTETVTPKVKEAVESLKKGKSSFKNDNSGNVHQVIGKLSFDENKLKENFEAFKDALLKAKPDGVKGKFIINATICSTMGPGLKIKF